MWWSPVDHINVGVNTLTRLAGPSRPRGQHRVELFLRVYCHVFRGVTTDGVWDWTIGFIDTLETTGSYSSTAISP
jgi:hypothetical protein